MHIKRYKTRLVVMLVESVCLVSIDALMQNGDFFLLLLFTLKGDSISNRLSNYRYVY